MHTISFASVRRLLLSTTGKQKVACFCRMASTSNGHSDVWEQKKELRKSVKEALKNMTDDQKASESKISGWKLSLHAQEASV